MNLIATTVIRYLLFYEVLHMREKQIKVLMVKALEEPRETVLQNDLDSLQKAVSIEADYQGLIEIIGIDDDVCILCNEEGKINGLPLNRPLRDDEGNIYDIIAGVFYVTGEDDDGNLTSLSPEMMEKYRKEFSLSNGAVIY